MAVGIIWKRAINLCANGYVVGRYGLATSGLGGAAGPCGVIYLVVNACF